MSQYEPNQNYKTRFNSFAQNTVLPEDIPDYYSSTLSKNYFQSSTRRKIKFYLEAEQEYRENFRLVEACIAKESALVLRQ